jgi:hypothetical protein
MKYGCIGEHLSHSFSKEIHAHIAPYSYELCEVARERDFFITDGTPKNQKLDTKALKEFSSVLKEISSVLSDLNARESVPVDMGVRIEFSPEALGYSS